MQYWVHIEKNTHPPLVARAEEALSSRTVNTDRKRKNTNPLLAISPEDALFTRIIRRLYTPATSNICCVNTNRNSPSINIQNLSSNTAHARNDMPSYMDLGDCDQQCRHYGCLFWYNEQLKGAHYTTDAEYHLCYGGGQIYMPSTPYPPAFIQQLFKNNEFMKHIRRYNQMFAMTSFRAKIDHSVNKGRGPYIFKISDQIYHWIGSLCPEEDKSTLNPEIVEGLIHVFDEHNGLVRLFRTALDRCNAGDIPSFKIRLYNMRGLCGYELPTANVLRAIMFENGPRSRTNFDVIIEFIGGPPQTINKLHQSYMSLQFPLLFIFGQPGFYPELTLKPYDGKGRGTQVTMNAYYKYQLHPRTKDFGLIIKGGRLFQQYVVTVFCAIEQRRLDFIRKNQNDLRSNFLSRLYDAVSRGDREGIAAGSKIMLPRNPQFFITFTCNVKWPAIKRYMAQYLKLTPTDRADIVCRVFEQKVKDFLRFSKEVNTFGYVSAVLYTIEFQKRGLPHSHTLLLVDSKNTLKDASQIDEYISAEIPDPMHDPRGHKLVTELMMHRPCGAANLVHVVPEFPIMATMAACEALGLLGDDKEWDITLEESTASATSNEIRILFAQILIYCDVSDPVKLWAKHWEAIQDDILAKISEATDFGLQSPLQHLLKDVENKLLMEEKNYKRDLLTQDAAQSVPKLNHDQKTIYDLIIGASVTKQQQLLFVYGNGGTGKTFLWKKIISSLRSEGKIFWQSLLQASDDIK
ncbi:DNA helicase [Tanacetum coccineum]